MSISSAFTTVIKSTRGCHPKQTNCRWTVVTLKFWVLCGAAALSLLVGEGEVERKGKSFHNSGEVGAAAWWASLCYVDLRLGGLKNYAIIIYFLVLYYSPSMIKSTGACEICGCVS